MAKTRTKKLSNGKVQFYTGNRKATETEAKQFIKETLKKDTGLIDPKNLYTDSLRTYAGQVKGGLNRASHALTDDKGLFISSKLQSKTFEKIGKELGIDIPAILEAKQTESLNKLFQSNPLIKERYEELKNGDGIDMWFNVDKVKDRLQTFSGKIFINGKEYSAMDGYKKVRDKISEAKRITDCQDVAVRLKYKGNQRIDINLPTASELEELEDPFGEFDGMELYGSSKAKK